MPPPCAHNIKRKEIIVVFQIDLKCRKSIYEQVIDNIKDLIIAGILAENERLPSVRELSKTLTVNPNTVQKAYRELERQGYLYSSAGLGSFVRDENERPVDEKKMSDIKERIRRDMRELRFLGMTNAQVRELVDEIITERGETL